MCSCCVLGLGSLALPLSGLRCCFWLLDLGRMLDLGIVMEPWLQLVLAPEEEVEEEVEDERVRSRRRRRPTVAWGVSSVVKPIHSPK